MPADNTGKRADHLKFTGRILFLTEDTSLVRRQLEAAGDDAATVAQAGGPQQLLRPVEHVRLIEKDALQRPIRGKQRGEEGPEAAADVDEPLEPAEVIGLEQRCVRPAGQSHHRRVEDGTRRYCRIGQ